jgi:hypothetical protein
MAWRVVLPSGNHRRPAGVDSVDDLGVVDALQVDRSDGEVRVPELALDHDKRDALSGHLDGVSMAKLMRCEPPTHTCTRGNESQLCADGSS